jgi:hypothetical protein
VRSATQLVLQDQSAPGYVIVRFLPQHNAERAYLEDAVLGETPDSPGSVKSRLARETRLAFVVPPAVAPIPYSLNGLLDWTRWGQHVVATAKPPEYVKDRSTHPAIDEPAPDQTAIEAPWRLMLSPYADAGWAHASQPVSHDGRTELWHTRLGERKTNASGSFVDESDPTRRTVRAIWSPDYNKNQPPTLLDAGPFRTSLKPRDRHDIVRLTAAYQTANYNPNRSRSTT